MYNESSLDVHDHVHVHDGSKSPTYRKVHFGSCTRVQFPESVLPANFFKCSGVSEFVIDDRIAIGGRSFSVAKRWSLIFVTDEELGVT